MTVLRVIADDVTGACDVGAELAAAGRAVRVAVDGDANGADDDGDANTVRVFNTQSRTLSARGAYERVAGLLRRHPADLLLKKIDTALRGHLGAELDAALDGFGAVAVFVLPSIPGAGRVTREGCQWFAGRPLGSTEFARDPEGPGAESSVAAVVARESHGRTEVISRGVIAAGGLAGRARALIGGGATFFVVDAETDADLANAVTQILTLPRPLCLAGSIALAGALAPLIDADGAADPAREHKAPPTASSGVGRASGRRHRERAVPSGGGKIRSPILVVCGSLHAAAHAQIDLATATGLAVRVMVPSPATPAAARAALTTEACAHLVAGRSVVLETAPPATTPDAPARRATERLLAELVREAVNAAPVATLVCIGGETSYAALRELGATELALGGRFAPLVAVGEILDGAAAGRTLVTKGGSGGEADTLAALLAGAAGAGCAARNATP